MVSAIAAKAAVSTVTIHDWVRQAGFKRRYAPRPRGDVRHDAFSELTPESMYWAGVLITDGCIVGKNNDRIKLSLKRQDADHIELFKAFIGSTNGVTYYDNVAETRATSKRMAGDLLNLGISPRKTFTAKACDKLAESWDFWRGCIDGDGGLHIYEYQGPSLVLTGASIALHDQWSTFIRKNVSSGLSDSIITYKRAELNTHDTIIHGMVAVIVVERLYRNALVALRRKIDVANQIIQWRSKYKRKHHAECLLIPGESP